jgi:hypothetical protein
VGEGSWFSPTIVVSKKNGKLKIYVDFLWFNAITKKSSYPLPFIKKLLNEVMGHYIYSFWDGFYSYH